MPKRIRTQPNTQTTAFGSRVKALRHEQGMSLDDLAAMSGLTKGHLSQIENAFGAVTLDTISKLAKGFGVSPMYIMIWDTLHDERERVAEQLRSIPRAELRVLRRDLQARAAARK